MKLTCVNWPTHLEVMLAEGLDKQPLKDIVSLIAQTGINCVRLTWATFMFTRYSNVTVEATMSSLNLTAVMAGVTKYNPFVLKKTHIEAYDAVVNELAVNKIMMVIDNHVSEPKWCCSDNDGNTFFGDTQFDPQEWLQGLSLVAKRYRGNSQVVGLSLRNELRGRLQNEETWRKYVTQGATTIHEPLMINLDNKLVYEVHEYPWSKQDAGNWVSQPVNQICGNNNRELDDKASFLMSSQTPTPLFLTEFGIDLNGKNEPHNSYYIRQGTLGVEEVFGILDYNWKQLRYPQFPQRFQLLKRINQDPNSKNMQYYIMFHPLTGQCVQANNKNELEVDDCGNQISQWSQDANSRIRLTGSSMCLKAVGEGLPPTLSNECTSQQTSWKSVSQSGLHLATSDGNGQQLCLDRESFNSSKIVTRKCICIQDDPKCLDDPQNQWFKLVSTNVK
ncbi:Endoglucanase [Quillaja saponaria]|uniref:Endoglucanase n=1 Tax=Quillaja saponaria TaxID=32244 RepID=A0AAD7PUF9_QUISA|nr:Endoglucanase [Quillaja saponaria]